MKHAFNDYSIFKGMERVSVHIPTTENTAIIEAVSPDPFSTDTIRLGAKWGIKVRMVGKNGSTSENFKWFDGDDKPINEGSILQGRIVDAALLRYYKRRTFGK